MKKLAIFLVLAMLLSCVAGAASTGLVLDALVEVPAAGDTGTVSLKVSLEEASVAGTVTVSYDNSALTFVSAAGTADLYSVKASGNTVTLIYSNLEEKTGELANLLFNYDATVYQTTAVDVKVQYNAGADETVEVSDYIAIELLTDNEVCPSAAYDDLDTDKWYHEAVDYVLATGIMNGMGNGCFQPDAATTRGQFVAVLSRVAGVDVTAYDGVTEFTDVAEDSWYAPYVDWAVEAGLVKGDGNGTFRPDASISRQELVTIMARFAEAADGDTALLESYDDADQVATWAAGAMAWAVENGVIQGYGNGLKPTSICTRAQIAQIILNYMN